MLTAGVHVMTLFSIYLRDCFSSLHISALIPVGPPTRLSTDKAAIDARDVRFMELMRGQTESQAASIFVIGTNSNFQALLCVAMLRRNPKRRQERHVFARNVSVYKLHWNHIYFSNAILPSVEVHALRVRSSIQRQSWPEIAQIQTDPRTSSLSSIRMKKL